MLSRIVRNKKSSFRLPGIPNKFTVNGKNIQKWNFKRRGMYIVLSKESYVIYSFVADMTGNHRNNTFYSQNGVYESGIL